MSYRMKITLPETVAARLAELAARTKEPPARVAAQMVRAGIGQANTSGKIEVDAPSGSDLATPGVEDAALTVIAAATLPRSMRRSSGSPRRTSPRTSSSSPSTA
jgi:hypothetical protein